MDLADFVEPSSEACSSKLTVRISIVNMIREAAKKISFFSGPATKRRAGG